MMMKTQLQAPLFNKTKTCAMVSHTLSLSNGTPGSIFKSLCFREIRGSIIPKYQVFHLTTDHFLEDSLNEIRQGCKWTNNSKPKT